MASLASDPNGRKRINYFDPNGNRKTLRLGKMDRKQADVVRGHLEHLLTSKTIKSAVPQATAEWIAGLEDALHGKLADQGLIAARGSATIGGFITEYVKGREADTRSSTQRWYNATLDGLLVYFGAEKPMREVTPGDVDNFRLHLLASGLGDNTMRRRLGICRHFFKAAIRRHLLTSNPFADVKVSVQANHARFHFITRADALKIIDKCPNAEWKAIVALSRFGGLRAPSEVLALRWQDVNWEENRLVVPQPKMETRGKPTRTIPLFPEVKAVLLEAFEAAEPGSVYVVNQYRDPSTNLRTQFERIIKRAGVEVWGKPFQNMRSSRETELAATYPLHVVCAWIGNTEPVAAKHYLQITSEHFEAASKPVETPEKDAAQNAAQYPAERAGKPEKVRVGEIAKTPENIEESSVLENAMCSRQESNLQP